MLRSPSAGLATKMFRLISATSRPLIQHPQNILINPTTKINPFTSFEPIRNYSAAKLAIAAELARISKDVEKLKEEGKWPPISKEDDDDDDYTEDSDEDYGEAESDAEHLGKKFSDSD